MLSLSTGKPDCMLPFGATTVVSSSEVVVAFGECQLDDPLLKDFVVEYCRNGLLQYGHKSLERERRRLEKDLESGCGSSEGCSRAWVGLNTCWHFRHWKRKRK